MFNKRTNQILVKYLHYKHYAFKKPESFSQEMITNLKQFVNPLASRIITHLW